MSTQKNLTTLGVAAVFALGLAACGGGGGMMTGGGPPAGPTLTLMDLTTAGMIGPGDYVAADDLGDQFSDEDAMLLGQTFMAGASVTAGTDDMFMFMCSEDSTDGCSVTINDDGSITVVGTIYVAGYMPPMPNPVASLNAMAVATAIGPTATLATTAPHTAVRGMVADDATDTTNDDDFEMSDAMPASLGEGWMGTIHMRTTTEDDEDTEADETVTEMVVNYTNATANTAQAYLEYYADGGVPAGRVPWNTFVTSASSGVLTLAGANVGGALDMITGDFGITAPHQLIPAPTDDSETTDVDEAQVRIMGSFHGVPGTFGCDSGCSRTSDADGKLNGLNGTWTFTPTELEADADPYMVAGVVLDTDFVDFGFWIVTSQGEDGPMYSVGLFQDGLREHTAQVAGEAEYAGPATGIYMTKTFNSETGEAIPQAGGQFTATANLKAYFGTSTMVPSIDHNTVSGTISNFMNSSGEMIDEMWELMLMRTAIESSGAIGTDGTPGVTGEGALAGTWRGQFYGPPDDGDATSPTAIMPGMVAGTFVGHFMNGHVAGAFGAEKVEDDE